MAIPTAAGHAPRPTDAAVIVCNRHEHTLLTFATRADARRWATASNALGATIAGAAPDDVDWSTTLGLASAQSAKAWSQWQIVRLARLAIGVLSGLLVGLAPNALFVFVESGVIEVQSELLQLVTIAVSATKAFHSLVVVPALAVRLVDLLRLPTRRRQGAMRVALQVLLNFVNVLVWPVGATLLIDPSCFRFAIIPPPPVTLDFSFDDCTTTCNKQDVEQHTCPDACGLTRCFACVSWRALMF